MKFQLCPSSNFPFKTQEGERADPHDTNHRPCLRPNPSPHGPLCTQTTCRPSPWRCPFPPTRTSTGRALPTGTEAGDKRGPEDRLRGGHLPHPQGAGPGRTPLRGTLSEDLQSETDPGRERAGRRPARALAPLHTRAYFVVVPSASRVSGSDILTARYLWFPSPKGYQVGRGLPRTPTRRFREG